jgi:hypothetical protein
LEQLGKLLPPALRACECKADLEDVRALAWGVWRGPGEIGHAVRLLLAAPASSGATRLTNAPEASWSSAHVEVLSRAASTERYTFEIRKP